MNAFPPVRRWARLFLAFRAWFDNVWDRDAQAQPVRLSTLIQLRWLAIVGQAVALLAVHYGLGFPLPFWSAMGAVAASVLFNAWLFLAFPAPQRLGHTAASLILGYDLLQLGFLLYLTGGLENPFAIFLLAPVTIAAAILRLRHTLALGALALLVLSVIGVSHHPLPWAAPGMTLPPLYQTGMFVALVISMAFLGIYVWQVAAEARRMQDALGATQLALARQKQLAAVGGLAAAAAHELGTPLATITLVAKELEREMNPSSPQLEDVRLLVSQAQRCAEILRSLTQKPPLEDQAGERFVRMPLPLMIEQAAAPYRRAHPALEIIAKGEGAPPRVGRQAEITHALGNLIQNALDFAQDKVTVELEWTPATIAVRIADDGPGIDPNILAVLGEPYVTSRPEGAKDGHGGMGLGVFIAKTLLEQTQAQFKLQNRNGGGAEALALWRRRDLEYREA